MQAVLWTNSPGLCIHNLFHFIELRSRSLSMSVLSFASAADENYMMVLRNLVSASMGLTMWCCCSSHPLICFSSLLGLGCPWGLLWPGECSKSEVVLFATVKRWKQPKCPRTEEWMNQMWYAHTRNVIQHGRRRALWPMLHQRWGLETWR